MNSSSTPDRRTVLTGAGVVVGGIAGSSVLAACGGSSSSPTAAAPTSASAGSSTAKSLAALDSIPDGSTISVKNPSGGNVLLTRSGSTVTGLDAKCTHEGCTVAPKGATLNCPCHGSMFQPGSGAVLNGPASEPLAPVAVTVAGGQVTLV